MKELTIGKSITDRDSRSIKHYLSELTSIPVLTPEEEAEIAYMVYNGDEEARQKLIKHNLKFVVSVAKQYKTRGIKLEDLINEGNIGLIKASHKFDPTRGFKFISYAVWQIRQSIITYIRSNGQTIRMPVNRLTKNSTIKKEVALLEQELERPPSYDEIIELLKDNYNEKEIQFYVDDVENIMKYLDAPLSQNDDAGKLLDLVPDESLINPDIYVNIEDSEIRKKALLNYLNPHEQQVITLTFGLDGKPPLSIREASEIVGVSPQRVGVVRDKSLRKLKFHLRNRGKWLKEV